MKVRGGATKHLNEHLGPLRRYLAGQVGRPWSVVHADICRHLNRGSAVQDHVRDHVQDYVAVNVLERGDELCHGDGYGVGWPRRTLFYICPRTGVLKKNKRLRARFQNLERAAPFEPVGHDTALLRGDGRWFTARWQKLPATPFPYEAAAWDALLERDLSRNDAERIFGRPIFIDAVRPATKREIRQISQSYPRTNRVR